jgi:hypothetical protein
MATLDEVQQKLLDKMAFLLDGDWHMGWVPADAIVQLADAYAVLAEAAPGPTDFGDDDDDEFEEFDDDDE